MASGTQGIASGRGGLLRCPVVPDLAGMSLSALGPTMGHPQPALLAPCPPEPALCKAFGTMEPGEELFQLSAGIGGVSIQTGSGGALCAAILGTVLLLSACGMPGAAGAEPSLCLAGGCREVMAAHGTGQSSFPYFLSWIFGWVWMGMAGELSKAFGSELLCCLTAPLNLLLHIRPDQMEKRNEFL